jgi:ribosomal protein S18 acetylase RimI-like enzyme
LQKEGLFAFFMNMVRFLRRCVFIYDTYYTYELPLNGPMQFEPAPKIQDFVFETVPTNQRLDELVAQGFDFGIHGKRARGKLDKGALMFCIFVGKEFACVHWAATTQEAMDVIFRIPYKVDFLNGDVYIGWSETTPKYKRLGLSQYLIAEKLKLFKTMGKTTVKWTVRKSNRASKGLTTKIGGRIYGEGRYLKILWWESWEEKPVIREESEPQYAKRVITR